MRRSHVLIGLALIVAIAIASPAIGGPSLKKLVKKEVAKQLAGKNGPQGPAGPAGTDGANGTARAYARVRPGGVGGCPPQPCLIFEAKGISSVTHTATGEYCVVAPGIDSADVTPAVSVDWGETSGSEGNASAMTNGGESCGGGGFVVHTDRQPSTTVRDAAGTGTTQVAGNAVPADDVGFAIVIP